MRGQLRAMRSALRSSASGQAKNCSIGAQIAACLAVVRDSSQLLSGSCAWRSCGSSEASAPRAARSLATQPPATQLRFRARRHELEERPVVRTPPQHTKLRGFSQKQAKSVCYRRCCVRESRKSATRERGLPVSSGQRRTSSARTRVSRGASTAAAASLRRSPAKSSTVWLSLARASTQRSISAPASLPARQSNAAARRRRLARSAALVASGKEGSRSPHWSSTCVRAAA